MTPLLAGLTTVPSPALGRVGDPSAAPRVRSAADLGGLEARSAALVLSGQQGGDLAASVLVVPFPGRHPGTTRLALVIDLDGVSLLAPGPDEDAGDETAPKQGDRDTGDVIVEVHAYALTSDGTLSAYFTQAFALDRAEPEERGQGWAGVKFLGALDVPPGEGSVRVLVRQRASGRLALRAIPVRVPDFAAEDALLLPPLVPEPVERWTLVAQSGAEAETPFPLDLGAASRSRWLVPSTRPVVEPSGRSLVLLGWRIRPVEDETGKHGGPVGGAQENAWAGAWQAHASWPEAGDAGEPTEEPSLRVTRLGELSRGLEARGLEARGLEAWDAELGSGRGRAGAATLEITSPGGETAALPVVLIPAGTELARSPGDAHVPGPPLWTDLMARSGDSPVPARAGPVTVAGSEEISDQDLARFQVAYLEALQPLAAGDRMAALTAVAAVERSGTARGTVAETLARGQVQVALDLSGDDPERLLPLIQLHGDLYREHRHEGELVLAAQTRKVYQGLVEIYARRSLDGEKGKVAGAALVGLAGQLLTYGNRLEAVAILERALELDPDQPAALLSLAQLNELVGAYSESVSLLRHLEELAPETTPVGAEARLRLGVNLRREGQPRAAAERLTACLAPDRPRWIRAVAYEELADLEVERGRRQAAAELLGEALERMPRIQRVYIQLASVQESLGRPAEARSLLARLEARVSRGTDLDQDTPRLRYCRWPRQAIETAREPFDRAAAERGPALAEALAGFAARGG